MIRRINGLRTLPSSELAVLCARADERGAWATAASIRKELSRRDQSRIAA